MKGIRKQNENVFEEAECFDYVLSKTAPADEVKIYLT